MVCIQKNHNENDNKLLIEGGGFPAFWYCYGNGKQMMNYYEPSLIAGYSAGSIVAILLLIPEINIFQLLETYANCIKCCELYSLEYIVRTMMQDILPNNAYQIANGKLGIILCEPENNNKCKMIIHWNSNIELIDCLVASCYNPCITNGLFNYVDSKYNCRDAIYSSNLNEFYKNFKSIIYKPRDHNNLLYAINNIIPVSCEKALLLYEQGTIRYVFHNT